MGTGNKSITLPRACLSSRFSPSLISSLIQSTGKGKGVGSNRLAAAGLLGLLAPRPRGLPCLCFLGSGGRSPHTASGTQRPSGGGPQACGTRARGSWCPARQHVCSGGLPMARRCDDGAMGTRTPALWPGPGASPVRRVARACIRAAAAEAMLAVCASGAPCRQLEPLVLAASRAVRRSHVRASLARQQ